MLKNAYNHTMATWNTRGLRGSGFEENINLTNEKLREGGLCLVQKIPTPITPVEIDDNRHITLAYFEQRSTVDYIGAVQGYPVCFDAKECAGDSFRLFNVHEHQFKFMKNFEEQGGIAFLLVYFSGDGAIYYMRFNELKKFIDRAEGGGAKHIKRRELNPKYFLSDVPGIPVPYLEALRLDIDEPDRK